MLKRTLETELKDNGSSISLRTPENLILMESYVG